ncbi:MAG: redoxin domain-containing protein [Anaerolineae bacterium]|nr:redoxin domain-containing protein [Anaerolineae bacterium]
MIVQKIDVGRVIAGLLLVMALLAVIEIQQQPRFDPPLPLPTLSPPTPPSAMTFIAPTPVPTARATPELAPYPIYGPAAEIRNEVWLNTDVPTRLADLRGRVVLLWFFAYDCPPCLPVLDTVDGWHAAYGEQGLSVIGVHYPRNDAERDIDNLVEALERLDVPYPVVQDNDGLTWNAYGQRVLPTLYLIDRRGFLRYRFVGVGGDTEIETAIRALLDEVLSAG